uniref:Uncharacterized protein n=1 Tax=Anguilla anguilla TaxID=7936 RepID=A0A0E9Q1B0_ANGAN
MKCKFPDRLGQSRMFQFLAMKICVALAVCLGSLSCFRMKHHPMSLETFA